MLKYTAQSNGEPFYVYRVCSPFICDSSYLGEVLEAILKRGLTLPELKNGTDIESLVGRGVELEIEHSRSERGTEFAKIQFVDKDDHPPF